MSSHDVESGRLSTQNGSRSSKSTTRQTSSTGEVFVDALETISENTPISYVNHAFDQDNNNEVSNLEEIDLKNVKNQNNNNNMSKVPVSKYERRMSRHLSRKSIRSPDELAASLIWNNLSFEVVQKKWKLNGLVPTYKSQLKQILKPQNGEIVAGTLTALMGPSGAGKSTLLNCLTGRYISGVKGQIHVTCRGPKPQATIAFVPQHDDLFRTFSVRETLVFASRMKNLSPGVDHEEEAALVMEYLSLENCSSTKVNRCSGGQVKRVCIGVELISHPDILVLDEPTTGLDSSTAAQCIQLLRRLADAKENPPAIVATIHQPNYKIFNEFTSVYLLSRNGQNIYNGSPLKIVEYFEGFKLTCPSYCNPADYAIEVAYGDYGQEVFLDMEKSQQMIKYDGAGRGTKFDLQKVVNKLRGKKMPAFMHTRLLLWRSWGNLFRDSNQFWLKNLQSLLIALIISYIWTYYVGEDDGCWDSFSAPINTTELKNNLFKVDINKAKDEYVTKISRMADNSAFIFACSIYTMLIALMTCVLSFPLETNVVIKEVSNNWYKTGSYFWAKSLADLPPMLVSNLILGAIVYPMTGQIPSLWRFGVFYAVICLIGEIGQSIGMAIGIVVNRDVVSASLITVSTSIPVIMFAGFLVRLSSMPWYFRPISYISYLRYAFEASLIAIYGYDRCKKSNGSSFIDDLLAATDPQEIARNMFESLDIQYSDVKRFSHILNVDTECLGDVFNKSVEYFGLDEKAEYEDVLVNDTLADIANSTSSGLLPSQGDNPSYVLSYYNLDDSQIYYDFAALGVFILTVKIIVYVLLRWKTRATE